MVLTTLDWNIFLLSHQYIKPRSSEFKIVTEKMKGYKSTGTDQIPAEVIQAGVK
jgi:hypothetical protein